MVTNQKPAAPKYRLLPSTLLVEHEADSGLRFVGAIAGPNDELGPRAKAQLL
jgi:hypothetical protein